MLLRSCPDVESRRVDELAANTDVPLLNEHSCMVDGLSKPLFVDLRLKAPLKEFLSGELKDKIEFELVIREKPITTHPTKESGTLKDTLGILGVEGQQGTSGLSQLGKSVLDTPNFTLTAETVLSNELELGIKTFFLVGTTWCFECLAVCKRL